MINLFPDSSLSNSNLALLACVTFRKRIWSAPSHNSEKKKKNIYNFFHKLNQKRFQFYLGGMFGADPRSSPGCREQ